MRLAALGFVLLPFVLFAGCNDSPAGPGGPPSCNGAGCGSCDAAECLCSNPGPCDATCGDRCKLTCSGTGSQGCNGHCGTGCHFTCAGPAECIAVVGANSEIVCSVQNGCAVSCPQGGCHASCPGPHGCELDCPTHDCIITSCSAGTIECAGGLLVCGRPCP